jgi:hypothetical protein
MRDYEKVILQIFKRYEPNFFKNKKNNNFYFYVSSLSIENVIKALALRIIYMISIS